MVQYMDMVASHSTADRRESGGVRRPRTDRPPRRRPHAGQPTPHRRAAPAAVLVFGATAATVWIGAAVLTAGHGFDITDEGLYLLSYRWWDSNHWTFTGAQYLYGPVFSAMDHNIAGLRLFRLVTVVATHLVFGWSWMAWLRLRRPAASASRLWEAAGVAVLVAAGGAVYGWLPLSPGYNDVVLLGALLATSAVLRIAADADRGRPVPAWVPAAWGLVAVLMLLTKWTSALVLGLTAAGALVTLIPRRRRELGRVAVCAAAGMAAGGAAMHVFVVPLTTAVPPLLAVNRLLAEHSMPPATLLAMYWTTTVALLDTALRLHVLLLLAGAVAVLARGALARRLAWVLGAAGAAVSGWRALDQGGLGGGTPNVQIYPVTLAAAVLLVLVVAAGTLAVDRLRRLRDCGGIAAGPVAGSSLGRALARDGHLLGLLLALPMAQALGTGNTLYKVAVNGFAAWTAVMIAVLTGIETAPGLARRLTAAVTAAAVAAVTCVAIGGLWHHPYRTAARAHTTEPVPGVPALASLRLDPRSAQRYARLRATLAPHLKPAGRAVIAFDKMPGIVLLLDGRPVGEAWTTARDPARMVAAARAACQHRSRWWGPRLPIVLFNRPATALDTRVLESCGLHLATEYAPLPDAWRTTGIAVYVPRGEAG